MIWECPNLGAPFQNGGEQFLCRQVAMISRVREHDQLHVKLDESTCRCLLLRRWDELALALSELTSSGKGIFCHGGSCDHGSGKGLKESSGNGVNSESLSLQSWMDC